MELCFVRETFGSRFFCFVYSRYWRLIRISVAFCGRFVLPVSFFGTRGVGGLGLRCPRSAQGRFALASADKSSPRPLRAQFRLLIRDFIPSRFIFTKKSSKICVYQKKAVPLPPQRLNSLCMT